MPNNSLEEEARELLGLLVSIGRRGGFRDPLATLFENSGLTPGQFHSINWLGLDGDLTMGQLAHRLGVSEKTVTGIVDRLERGGYAERRRRDDDRRVVFVALTRKGAAIFRRMERQIIARTKAMLAVLEEGERRVVRRLIERLVEDPDLLARKARR